MQLLRVTLFLIIVSLTVSCQSNGTKKVTKEDLATDSAKVSYALGIDLGKNIKLQGIEVDLDIFLAALRTSMEGSEALMTEEEITQTILSYHTKKREANEAKMSVEREKNKADGAKFLEENKTKAGVKTTASGLQYMVIEEASGKKPSADSKVTVNYVGTFIDGKEFDSSYKRGQPATFPLNGVIRGWTEGLQLMSVGSKYKFFIPYELAYGENGRPGSIPPASVLIFEIELLDIK